MAMSKVVSTNCLSIIFEIRMAMSKVVSTNWSSLNFFIISFGELRKMIRSDILFVWYLERLCSNKTFESNM